MDENTRKKMVTDLAEQAVPADHDPWPAIQRKLQASHPTAFKDKEDLMNSRITTRRTWKTAAAVSFAVLFLLGAFLITPQGQVLAQRIVSLFTRTDQQSFPLSPEQIAGAKQAEQGEAQPTALPPASYVFFTEACAGQQGQAYMLCQVELAEETAGFEILLPPLDAGLVLTSLAVDTAQDMVIASFGYDGYPNTENSLTLLQGTGGFPAESEWQAVPEQEVEGVIISGQPGEYVQGTFAVQPGASEAAWVSDPMKARLRWRNGDRWFELLKSSNPGQVTWMNQDGMVRLAEALAPLP